MLTAAADVAARAPAVGRTRPEPARRWIRDGSLSRFAAKDPDRAGRELDVGGLTRG